MLGRDLVKQIVVAAGLCSLIACGSDSDSDKSGDTGGEGTGGENGSNGSEDNCGPDPMSSKPSAMTGTITGVIKVAEADKAAAKGNLFIAVLKESDFSTDSACKANAMQAAPAANYLERCVDLSKDFSYSIPVPPLAEENYLVVAFLDVNKNVDPSKPETAGPDACDMIALGATAKISAAGEMAKAADITLGPGGPLLMGLGCAACSN